MYLPPAKKTLLWDVCVCVCVCVWLGGVSPPYCFIASAMYSHVLMGFSNLTTGLEIMKGDKENW